MLFGCYRRFPIRSLNKGVNRYEYGVKFVPATIIFVIHISCIDFFIYHASTYFNITRITHYIFHIISAIEATIRKKMIIYLLFLVLAMLPAIDGEYLTAFSIFWARLYILKLYIILKSLFKRDTGQFSYNMEE